MSNLERAKSQGSNKQQTLSNQTPILFQRLIKLYAINLKMVVIIPYTETSSIVKAVLQHYPDRVCFVVPGIIFDEMFLAIYTY